jgi:putative Mg2+ transporter-C (MgtC) family protein
VVAISSMILQLTPDIEALLRMGLAVLCGMAVGINRAHHGATPHPNRLRVHVLVGLSAALMVMAAGSDPQARSRVIQGVAKGLSSAASIWFTAALGVTVAASSPLLALLALLLALITLSDRSNGDEGNGNGSESATRPRIPEEDPDNLHRGEKQAAQKRKR